MLCIFNNDNYTGTPIINPPQSAILGMHGVFERPVVRNGQVTIVYTSHTSGDG